MKVLVTGSAGRVGRAIYIKLMHSHHVIGLDTTPCSTADFVGDIRDKALVRHALNGVDVIVHTAALHAPHVSLHNEQTFNEINVDATEQLALLGIEVGIKQFIFTSTTALYGHASTPNGTAGWVNEQTVPKPKTVYHRSKILAERKLQSISSHHNLPVTVLQMSRCFPEPADLMAVYRLTRGVDARDVAFAHQCAIEKCLQGFNRFIISGVTPFNPSDTEKLYNSAEALLTHKCPNIAAAFKERNWCLPKRLDRVYDSSAAQTQLEWHPKFGFEDVLSQLDNDIAEVLPVIKNKLYQ
ncbi:NAD(P)-dependent oxidoreductase [Pseudoalteromonas sp. SMS1]|uniref:NAD-dependent epimerase/dehydratase family protein n=1 Tax=Pseudoalteromonas sp. SMS1 TaxID=2908894 RepID=UPI001F1F0BD6|nr:NAD(P)-dependent oxidoreductase [Pseudoalteromonas sp. SMS1]MCF2859171.1 NAD(P)-dependent oxidoreductase [Pseudoalteromonas sp. SMS1]